MGLAGFKLREGHKHKDPHEKTKRKHKGKEGKDKEDSPPTEPLITVEASTSSADITPAPSVHGPTSGWSWILESWFCRGSGQRNDQAGTSSALEVYDTQATFAASQVENTDCPNRGSDLPHSQGDACLQEDGEKKQRKDKKGACSLQGPVGPYELLAKERLMGIYMAVFIYRDLKPLVRGICFFAVHSFCYSHVLRS